MAEKLTIQLEIWQEVDDVPHSFIEALRTYYEFQINFSVEKLRHEFLHHDLERRQRNVKDIFDNAFGNATKEMIARAHG
jgi:hypothetical protein